jgi:hypothetical protein
MRQLQYLPVTDALATSQDHESANGLPTSDAQGTLLDAMLKLLETNAPALAIQSQSTQETLGYITLSSINRKITQISQKESVHEGTAI